MRIVESTPPSIWTIHDLLVCQSIYSPAGSGFAPLWTVLATIMAAPTPPPFVFSQLRERECLSSGLAS
jgi:hypothetical protein